tara:strand:+ start:11919 stop:13097 length:1179 start_codon:yes stop_codon:yes gene_type:complete
MFPINYFYVQKGGAKLGTLGDLFEAGSKNMPDALKGLAKTSLRNLSELRKLDLDPSVLKSIDEAASSPAVIKQLDEIPPSVLGTLSPDLIKHADPKTLAKVDPRRLAKLDLDTIKKLDPDTMAKIRKVDDIDPFLAKNLDDIAKKGAKKGVASSGSETGKIVKASDDVSDVGKALDDIPVKGVDETADSAKAAQKSFLKKHPGKIALAGGITIGAATLAGFALDDFLKRNNTKFIITKTEKDKNDKSGLVLNIFYELDKEESAAGTKLFEFFVGDWVLIDENDSIPKLPQQREHEIIGVVKDEQAFQIKLKQGEMPITQAKSGKFRYKTDFANRMKDNAQKAAEGAAGLFKDLIGGVAEGLGIDPSTLKGWLIGIGITILIIIIILIALKFM